MHHAMPRRVSSQALRAKTCAAIPEILGGAMSVAANDAKLRPLTPRPFLPSGFRLQRQKDLSGRQETPRRSGAYRSGLFGLIRGGQIGLQPVAELDEQTMQPLLLIAIEHAHPTLDGAQMGLLRLIADRLTLRR